MNEYKTYTANDLSQRDGVQCAEVWIAYKGLIYDVTSSELFEGGRHYRLVCGCDLTEQMRKAPHFEDVLEKFPVVGTLSSETG